MIALKIGQSRRALGFFCVLVDQVTEVDTHARASGFDVGDQTQGGIAVGVAAVDVDALCQQAVHPSCIADPRRG